MTPVKLSEVKVGDVIWDLPYDGEFCTTLKVAKIEDGRVWMNYISGEKDGYKFSDGFIVYSLRSDEPFYKPLNQ